jgi:hypothetical protein
MITSSVVTRIGIFSPSTKIKPTIESSEFIDIDPVGNNISMRLIQADEFTMGDNAYAIESPAHKLDLSAFYMDTYEVINFSTGQK